MRGAVLLVLLLALSGCGEPEPEPTDAGGDADDAQATAPQGGIGGVVVTTTIQPVPGALVELLDTGDEATTDLFGRFSFDVGPGTYRLRASAPEHSSAEQTVTVEENKTARPRIQLESLVAATPFHQTFQFDGRVDASLGPADEPAGPGKEVVGVDGCDCLFDVPVGRNTVALTVEALWEDTFNPGDQAPVAYRYNVTSGTGTAWATGSGPSPLLAHLTEADFTDGFAFADHAVLTVSLLPDAVWPTFDQTYTLFVTAWEIDGPPADWAYLDGDR